MIDLIPYLGQNGHGYLEGLGRGLGSWVKRGDDQNRGYPDAQEEI